MVRSTYFGTRADYLIQIGALAVRVEGRTGPMAVAGELVSLGVSRAIAYADATSDTTSLGPTAT